MVQSGDTAAESTRSFLVSQGDQQYSLEPFGNGKTIEEFYRYGEHGHAHSNPQIDIEQSNASILFFWTGPKGISLVMIHDRPHDIRGGGEVEFTFENLPDEGGWVVRDDDPGNDTYSETEIDWLWFRVNTDGAAFRGGLTEVEEVVIRPNFQEGINEWQLLTGDLHDPTRISLDLDDPIRISPGSVVDSVTSTLDELDDRFGDGVDSGVGESVQAARGQLMRSLVKMSDNLAVILGDDGQLQRGVTRAAVQSLEALEQADANLGPHEEDIVTGLATALAEHGEALQEIDPQTVSSLQFDENVLTMEVVPASEQLRRYLSQSADVYFSNRSRAESRYSSAYTQSQSLYRTYLGARKLVTGLSGVGDSGTVGPSVLSQGVPSAAPGILRRIDRLLLSYNRILSFAYHFLFTEVGEGSPGGQLDSRIYAGERIGNILIEDDVYLIYDTVAGYPPDSHAYTDINGRLVEPNRAVDVAIGHVFSNSYAFDSRDRLRLAREHQRKFENAEDMARAANILAELSGAIALAKIDPAAALSHAAAAVEGALEWAEYEIDNPYREQFAKMAATSSTLRWADQEVPEPNGSLLSFSEEGLEVAQLAVDAVGLAKSFKDLASSASTVREIYEQTDTIRTNVPTSQIDGVDDLKSTSYTMVAGLAVDAVVGAATNIAESQARQAALGAGSAGARKAILEKIVSLEQQLDNVGLGPMGILRLQSLKQTEYQMHAATWKGIGAMQRELSEGTLGPGYDALFGTDDLARQASQTAEGFQNLAHFTTIQTGRAFERALTRYETSVNADRFGTQTLIDKP